MEGGFLVPFGQRFEFDQGIGMMVVVMMVKWIVIVFFVDRRFQCR